MKTLVAGFKAWSHPPPDNQRLTGLILLLSFGGKFKGVFDYAAVNKSMVMREVFQLLRRGILQLSDVKIFRRADSVVGARLAREQSCRVQGTLLQSTSLGSGLGSFAVELVPSKADAAQSLKRPPCCPNSLAECSSLPAALRPATIAAAEDSVIWGDIFHATRNVNAMRMTAEKGLTPYRLRLRARIVWRPECR